jgi:hypothetical protein
MPSNWFQVSKLLASELEALAHRATFRCESYGKDITVLSHSFPGKGKPRAIYDYNVTALLWFPWNKELRSDAYYLWPLCTFDHHAHIDFTFTRWRSLPCLRNCPGCLAFIRVHRYVARSSNATDIERYPFSLEDGIHFDGE